MSELGFYRRYALEHDFNWRHFCKTNHKEVDGVFLGRKVGNWVYISFDPTLPWKASFFEVLSVPMDNILEDYL